MTDQAAPTPAAETEKKAQGQFALQRIYVKDISFESPNSPAVFTQEWNPETKITFSTSGRRVTENQYEVVLALNVTATLGDKVAFIVEIKQAGIFLIEAPEATLEVLLGAQCPGILFAYAREAVSDLVARGSFPQLLLQPMNFDAIYMDAKRRREQQGTAEAPKH